MTEFQDEIPLTDRISFQKIPEEVKPGMLYTTPKALFESGVTSYSLPHIVTLIKRGIIPYYRVGGQVILEPEAVQKLLDRERDSNLGRLHPGGRRPGPENKESRRHRYTQEKESYEIPT